MNKGSRSTLTCSAQVCGYDLKAKERSLFAQPHLGSEAGVFITAVKHGFSIRLLGEQYVINDAGDPVCGRCNSLHRPQLCPHAMEKFVEIAFRGAEGVGPEPESYSGSII